MSESYIIINSSNTHSRDDLQPAANSTREAAEPLSFEPVSLVAAAASVAVSSSHERSRLGLKVPAALALLSSVVEIS